MKVYSGNELHMFVIYDHGDAKTVFPIIKQLNATGFRLWYNEEVENGTECSQNVIEHMTKASSVMIFMSSRALDSRKCINEINLAVKQKKEMIVVYLEDITVSLKLQAQLVLAQSLYKTKFKSEKDFLDELINTPSIQAYRESDDDINASCEVQAASAENTQTSDVDGGRANAVLKVVLKRIVPIVLGAAALVVLTMVTVLVLAVTIPSTQLSRNYKAAQDLMANGQYEEAIAAFEALDGHKDSELMIEDCKVAIADEQYNTACVLIQNEEYEKAIAIFEKLEGYNDSVAMIEECKAKLVEKKYINALELMDNGKYEEALDAFEELGEYKDSAEKIAECNLGCKYNEAIELIDEGKYEQSRDLFLELENYRDSKEYLARFKVCYDKMEIHSSSGYHEVYEYSYYSNGVLKSETINDANGQIIENAYNENGKITSCSVFDPYSEHYTEYTYDNAGHLTKEVYSSLYYSGRMYERTTQYRYNAKGLLVEKVYVDEHLSETVTTYTYNDRDQLTREEEKVGDVFGGIDYVKTITYSYDRYGNLSREVCTTSKGTGGYTREYDYNSAGQMTRKVTMGEEYSNAQYTYDSKGNLVREVVYLHEDDYNIEYEYDDYGNLTRRKTNYFDTFIDTYSYEGIRLVYQPE